MLVRPHCQLRNHRVHDIFDQLRNFRAEIMKEIGLVNIIAIINVLIYNWRYLFLILMYKTRMKTYFKLECKIICSF